MSETKKLRENFYCCGCRKRTTRPVLSMETHFKICTNVVESGTFGVCKQDGEKMQSSGVHSSTLVKPSSPPSCHISKPSLSQREVLPIQEKHDDEITCDGCKYLVENPDEEEDDGCSAPKGKCVKEASQ